MIKNQILFLNISFFIYLMNDIIYWLLCVSLFNTKISFKSYLILLSLTTFSIFFFPHSNIPTQIYCFLLFPNIFNSIKKPYIFIIIYASFNKIWNWKERHESIIKFISSQALMQIYSKCNIKNKIASLKIK